jgi:hypothetical protein
MTSLPSAPPRAWLLIGLLILASAGCTRRDWVGDMLVLTDVSGKWNGQSTMAWESEFLFEIASRRATGNGRGLIGPRRGWCRRPEWKRPRRRQWRSIQL